MNISPLSKRDVGWEVERRAAMRHLFSCGRADIVFRQAGIGALAFDADGLHQPAIGGELHELLMILVGGPSAAQQAKGGPTGITCKEYRQLAPQKGGWAERAAATEGAV